MGNVKRLLDKFGFGWIISSTQELAQISLSDLRPIALWGDFDSGFALGEYSRSESANRKKTRLGHLLHRFKYEEDREAGMILADLASAFINSQLTLKSADLMVSIPPSLRSRSFDPVSFLAEMIEERTNIPWERGVFSRTRLTKPQKSIRNKEFKSLNVLNSFRLSKPLKLNGKRILLVDDVFDSGATLDQITGILREAGAAKTYALVLARTRGFGSVGSLNQQASLR